MFLCPRMAELISTKPSVVIQIIQATNRTKTFPRITQVTTEVLDEIKTFFFSTCQKVRLRHNELLVWPIEFLIGPEMDIFRLFLARADIVSTYNHPGDNPKHHR